MEKERLVNRSFGAGVGAHGGAWGAAPFKNNPYLLIAQRTAALTMFLPLAAGCVCRWNFDCRVPLGAGSQSCLFTLSWIIVMPMAILNHCAHASSGQWQVVNQKLDRTFISIGLMPGTWALSQNIYYTAVQVVFGCSVIVVMWAGPQRYRDSEILATGCVGIAIQYALLSIMIFGGFFDLNFWLAEGALLAGMLSFQLDPFGLWTDAIWHGLLAISWYVATRSSIAVDQVLFGHC